MRLFGQYMWVMKEKLKILSGIFIIIIVLVNSAAGQERSSFFPEKSKNTFYVRFRTEHGNKTCMDSETAIRKMVMQMIPWNQANHELLQILGNYSMEQREQFWNSLLMIQRTNLYVLWEEQGYAGCIDFPESFLLKEKTDPIQYQYEEEVFQLQNREMPYCIYLNNPTSLALIPYCYVSAGKTRGFHRNNQYMEGVACDVDYQSREFAHEYFWTKEDFFRQIRKLYGEECNELSQLEIRKDNNSYADTVCFSFREVSVKEFQKSFSLLSADFAWREQKDTIVINSYGLGNGYGISIYTLSRLIEQGKNYDEIFCFFLGEAYLKRVV